MLGRLKYVQPLVPQPSSFEIKIAIYELQRYKSPDIDQILAELIKAGGTTLKSGFHKLNNSI
jgi:hypothetical protein